MVYFEWIIYILFAIITFGWIRQLRLTIDVSYPTIFNTLYLLVICVLFLIFNWNKLHLIWIYLISVPLPLTSYLWLLIFNSRFRLIIIILSDPFFKLCKIGVKKQHFFDE